MRGWILYTAMIWSCHRTPHSCTPAADVICMYYTNRSTSTLVHVCMYVYMCVSKYICTSILSILYVYVCTQPHILTHTHAHTSHTNTAKHLLTNTQILHS
eukprot:GHVQ01017547.1.p1 GENE.GHVQ01017547.1~~GHVQ01017547.1.p1  ORF type:complete len:100 (-),score=14.74 GHVQ01017547.1:34-333(-)